MEIISLDQLKYPIGKFAFNKDAGEKEINQSISEIEQFPAALKNAVKGLSDSQLDTPYREGGWTVRQVVHHMADSHMNAFIRIKLALTEDHPTIKPYEENLWAEMSDSKTFPIDSSISLVESLHVRWVDMLKHIKPAELDLTVFHPASKRDMSVKFLIGLYAWHGKHHVAHITELRKRMKW